jgi:hypothetical protein
MFNEIACQGTCAVCGKTLQGTISSLSNPNTFLRGGKPTKPSDFVSRICKSCGAEICRDCSTQFNAKRIKGNILNMFSTKCPKCGGVFAAEKVRLRDLAQPLKIQPASPPVVPQTASPSAPRVTPQVAPPTAAQVLDKLTDPNDRWTRADILKAMLANPTRENLEIIQKAINSLADREFKPYRKNVDAMDSDAASQGVLYYARAGVFTSDPYAVQALIPYVASRADFVSRQLRSQGSSGEKCYAIYQLLEAQLKLSQML